MRSADAPFGREKEQVLGNIASETFSMHDVRIILFDFSSHVCYVQAIPHRHVSGLISVGKRGQG